MINIKFLESPKINEIYANLANMISRSLFTVLVHEVSGLE